MNDAEYRKFHITLGVTMAPFIAIMVGAWIWLVRTYPPLSTDIIPWAGLGICILVNMVAGGLGCLVGFAVIEAFHKDD